MHVVLFRTGWKFRMSYIMDVESARKRSPNTVSVGMRGWNGTFIFTQSAFMYSMITEVVPIFLVMMFSFPGIRYISSSTCEIMCIISDACPPEEKYTTAIARILMSDLRKSMVESLFCVLCRC